MRIKVLVRYYWYPLSEMQQFMRKNKHDVLPYLLFYLYGRKEIYDYCVKRFRMK